VKSSAVRKSGQNPLRSKDEGFNQKDKEKEAYRARTLPFSSDLTAVQQIHIPDSRLGWQSFDSNFSLSSSAKPAHPHHTKLRLVVLILQMQNRACPYRTHHPLQHRSTIANVFDLRMLRERQGLGVHAPDAHRKQCRGPPIPTPIHSCVHAMD
jgi:hypothetical protein